MRLLTIILLILAAPIYSQTGPGGVGNTDGASSLKIWLRGDDLDADADFTDNPSNGALVSTWSDYSGNSNNFTQSGSNRPTYSIGTFNAVNFNASAATVQFMNATSGGSYNNFSAFFVTTPIDVNVSHTLFDGTSTSLRVEQWNNTNLVGFTRYGVADYSSTLSTPFGTRSILSFHKSAGSSTMNFRRNNAGNNVNIGSSSAGIPYNTLGRNSVGADKATGDFFEVILFHSRVNNAQRIIIQNYLSAKYGNISIQQNFYNQDNAGSGNFDFKVAGIGRTNASNIHSDSQGTGIIRINNPSALTNNNFLFWGEDVKDANYTFSITDASNNYVDRIDTKWRVSKRNNLGTVTVSVNASDLNFNSPDGCNQLQLVIDNNSNFSSPIITHTFTLSGTGASAVYTATGVNFSNNNYFTLQYVDTIVLDDTTAYNGSGISNVSDTSDGCYKLLIKSTADGTPSLSENANVREVEVESGGKLVLDDGFRLQVTNGIQLDGEIRLIGDSQLLQTHTGTSQVTGSGNLYKDKQGILTDVFQSGYWSSPVTTIGSEYTIAGALKDGTVVTSATSTPSNITFVDDHNGATTSPITLSRRWLASFVNSDEFAVHQNENQTYNPGEGFNTKSTGNTSGQNYTFIGLPNDGDYSSAITYGYFSLLGNPYPSVLDGNQFLSDNSAVLNTLYFWDGENDNSGSHIRSAYQGGYATYVSGIGTPFGAGATPNQYVSVGQGFLVYASTTGTIVFNNAQRNFSTASSFYGKSSVTTPFPILRIGLDIELDNNEIYHRQLGVGFRGLTNNLDEGDAYMLDFQPSDFALVVNDTPGLFVITGIEDYSESIEIPLRVYLNQQRNLTFKIDAIENFTPTNIFLKDADTNQFYDLATDVDLTLPAGDYVDRFFVTFNNGVLSTGEETIDDNNILISDNDDVLNVRTADNTIINTIAVYSILGQILITEKVNASTIDLSIKFKKGQILIVKVELENGSVISKKFIKR
ncbi:MAG: hypothetical protein COA67_10255 [Lutibacter sp.]|nr:MAG: hypothetical protein COA67_10255 [Lutibacter sp.]